MSASLTDHLALLATAPNGIKRLRGLILELAVRGKLVPQDPSDEPASELLKRIEAEKARLVKEGRIRKAKALSPAEKEDRLFEVPEGWAWVSLTELVSVIDSGWSPACSDHPAPEATWGILKTTAVQQMRYLEYENKALPSNLKPRPECEVKSGDILITRAGPKNRVGISCLVESSRDRLMISDKIIRFHLVPGIAYDKFIVLCLNAGPTAGYLEKAKSGMAESQMNISQTKLAGARVPLPPLPEQHRIVARVDELMALCDRLEAEQSDAAEAHARLVDALLATLTASHNAAECAAHWQRLSDHFDTLFTTEASIAALKQTVLQLAVMGRLVPQDPNDEPASDLLKRIEAEKVRLVKEGKIRKPKVVEPVREDERPFEVPAGWEWIAFEGAWESSFYGPRFGAAEYVRSGGIPTIRTTDMVDCVVRPKNPPCVDISPEQAAQYAIFRGDILVTRSGSIGTLAIYDSDDPAIPSAYLIRLRVQQPISPVYSLTFMRSPLGQSLLGLGATAVGVPNINASKMASFPFPLPPLPEQHRIVAKVDELMTLCDRIQADLQVVRAREKRIAETLTTIS